MRSIAALMRARRREDSREIRAALVRHGWRIGTASVALQVAPSTLRSAIARDPRLEADYRARSPGRGRPRTIARPA